MRFAFQPFCAARRTQLPAGRKKPHTQSKRHEQSKIEYGQEHPANKIADELAKSVSRLAILFVKLPFSYLSILS